MIDGVELNMQEEENKRVCPTNLTKDPCDSINRFRDRNLFCVTNFLVRLKVIRASSQISTTR